MFFSAARAIVEYPSISQLTLQHAKGWAVYFTITLLDVGLIDNPRHAAIGKKTLCAVAENE